MEEAEIVTENYNLGKKSVVVVFRAKNFMAWFSQYFLLVLESKNSAFLPQTQHLIIKFKGV
jgi:hypothetical protein